MRQYFDQFRRLSLGLAVLLCAVGAKATVLVWTGGDGQWTNGANWTPAQVPASGDTIIFSTVTANCTVSALPDTLASITLLTNYTGTVTFLPNCAAGSNVMTLTADLIVNGGNLLLQADTNSLNGSGFTMHAASITIGTGGSISADAQGFSNQAGPGAGLNNTYYGGGGGSYGGRGGWSSFGQRGGTNLYGSVTNPLALGSGGGDDVYYSLPNAGRGGGAIFLSASGTGTINGIVTANGGAGVALKQGGGGSGGSLWIECSHLAGSGMISADGGAGGSRRDWEAGGGGGGGRVRLSYSSSTFTGTVSVAGGAGGVDGAGTPIGQAGYPGTFSFPDGMDVTVKRSFALAPGSYHIPTLIVRSNASLSCQANLATTSGVTITSDSVTIDQGATISADAQGFGYGIGPGKGATVTYNGGGGASHAGLGGQGENGGAGGAVIYGSSNSPTALGSGGGVATYFPNPISFGGGAIHLNASVGSVTVNGTLSANGGNGSRKHSAGGGSGGSLWVECGTLAGSGSISANGGAGGSEGSAGWGMGGGGGGGRISLASSVSTFSGTTNVIGGVGTNSGTAGMITLQTLEPFVLLPVISNATATSVTMTSAALNGVLINTGSVPPRVFVCWGPADGVSNKSSWVHSVDFGIYTGGDLPATYATNVDLSFHSNSFYYYRYCASNQDGEVWAPVANFMAGEVWLSPDTTGASQFGPVPGTVTVTRLSALTNEPVTVHYTLGGSATSGVDVEPLSGSVVLPAGVASVPIVVTPVIHRIVEGARELVITLAPGGYVMASSNQSTVTIAGNAAIPPMTLTWNGGDGQWTNAAAWSPPYEPMTGDTIVFSTNTANCTVSSLPDSLASITLLPGYTGRLTLQPDCVAGTNILNLTGNLTINGGVVIIKGNTNSANGAGLFIHAADITVGSGAAISADAQGFSNQGGPGAGTTNQYYGGGGGSYGGRGGWSSGGRKGGTNLYGSATGPVALGSGGGDDVMYSPPNAGNGGGAIALSASGTVTVNGTVSANGAPGITLKQGGGGSGGSVWIECSQLAGSGTVSADGGAGGSDIEHDSGGGGGGGRVRVSYSASAFDGIVSVAGGAGGSRTRFGQAGYPGTFSFPDGGNVTVKRSFALAPGAYHFPALVVQSNAILSCQGDLATTTGVTITSSAITVDQGGTLAADAQGFPADMGPGAGLTGSSDGGGGGSYGGRGGCSTGVTYGGTGGGTNLYGSATAPIALGSGGGIDSAFHDRMVAYGGGAINLQVGSGPITINGTLSANGGGANPNCQSGGGSGGSVWMVCDILAGCGMISADGGNGGNANNWANGGGGGGGRVKCSYNAKTFTGMVSVAGGADGLGGVSPGSAGYPGTFSFPDGGDVTMKRSFALAPGTYNIPTLVVQSNAILSCQGDVNTTSGVMILSQVITVEPGASLSADGQGFAHGAGAGKGGSVEYYGGGGASHAGLGGHSEHSSGAAGGLVIYGSSNSPVTLGSGGGVDTHYPNSIGSGGGAIHLLAASGTVTINGALSANGEKGSQRHGAGGGSGGSIWVDCGTLAGSGIITANGGAGGNTGGWVGSAGGGGGGGGRIRVSYESWAYTGLTNALGGAGPTNGLYGSPYCSLHVFKGSIYSVR